MTAGAGILHIEKPPEHLVVSGGLFHGLQLWVNLPSKLKMAEPRYQDLRSGQVGLATSPDGGALLRIISGEIAGVQGPGQTYTPATLIHATIAPARRSRCPGARTTTPWSTPSRATARSVSGSGRRALKSGQTAVFGSGDTITVAADPVQGVTPRRIRRLHPRRPADPRARAAYGPFVMNTKAELMQAFEDYEAGKLGSIPAAHSSVDASTPDA